MHYFVIIKDRDTVKLSKYKGEFERPALNHRYGRMYWDSTSCSNNTRYPKTFSTSKEKFLAMKKLQKESTLSKKDALEIHGDLDAWGNIWWLNKDGTRTI